MSNALSYSFPSQGMAAAMQLPAFRQAVAHENRRNGRFAIKRGDLSDPILREFEILTDNMESAL